MDAGYQELAENEQTLNDSKAQLDATKSQLDSLTQGKEMLFQAAAALGVPVTDTSDATALALLAQLERWPRKLPPNFAP